MFSDPFNEGDDAISQNNQVIDNEMGRGGTDINGGYDFWVDGSGLAQLLPGQRQLDVRTRSGRPGNDGAAISGVARARPARRRAQAAPATVTADLVGELLDYVLSSKPPSTDKPAENQECSWNRHSHPPFEDFEPLTVSGFDEP